MGRTVRLFGLMLIVSVLLLAGLLAFPLVTRSAPPSPWHVELDHYLAYRAGQVRLVAATQATKPWLFDEALSKDFFSANAFDPNDLNYSMQLESPYALPFPPVDVWCVLLQEAGSSADGRSARQVVFVAEHESLYIGYWVVHEDGTSPFNPQLAGDLGRIGCSLPVQP